MSNTRNILLSITYFSLSAALTALFIGNKYWLYPSVNAMVISGAIASAKWTLQLLAAWLWLGKEKWLFIKHLGLVCLMGSTLLFTYNLMSYLPLPLAGFTQFIIAIVIAVITMIVLYYKAIRKSNLSINWFWGWITCLIIAIVLQLTIVF